jgi:hypothetical protein
MDFLPIILPLIAAGCGAYFGAYLKKSAELRAIEENRKKILETRELVKKIDDRIAADRWYEQRHWQLAKEVVWRGLKQLVAVRRDLIVFKNIKAEADQNPQNMELVEQGEKVARRMSRTLDEMTVTEVMLEVVAGEAIKDRYLEVRALLSDTCLDDDFEISKFQAEYYDVMNGLTTEVRSRLKLKDK